MIRIVCESCGAKFQVPDSVGGRTTHCTKCKAVIKIPPAAQSGTDTGSFPAPEASSPARPGPSASPAPAAPATPPSRPASPSPTPAANSAADALAALSAAVASPARKPAPPAAPQPPPPAAPPASQSTAPAPAPRVAPAPPRAAAPAPVAAAPEPVEVPTPAYVVPDDLPQHSFDDAPPRKSRAALFITLGVVAAVVATVAICAPRLLSRFGGPGGGTTSDDPGQLSAIQADVTMAEETMAELPEADRIAALSPVSLDETRQKLVTAKTKHDDVVRKMQLMKMQGEKGKEMLARLQGNLQKITQNLKLVDEAYWPGPGSFKEMFDRVRPSVPQIVIPGPGGQGFLSSGSGFLLVSQGKWCVATNRHVITDAENGVKVIFRVGSLENPTAIEIAAPPEAIARIHRATDLAIIDLSDKDVAELKKNNIRPLPINPNPDTTENPDANPKDKPSNGDPCWLVGHPGGDSGAGGNGIQINTFGEGSIANIIDMPMFCECLEISAPINPGNSGGPLFNKHGRVIGQVTFYRKDKDRQNYAVSVNILRGLIENRTGNTWSWPKDEIQRILAPWKTLPEDYKQAAKSLLDQGYVQVPLGTGVAKGVNTALDTIPFNVAQDKPHRLLIVTGKSSIMGVVLGKVTGRIPGPQGVQLQIQGLLKVQKDKCVELPIDVPAGPDGHYALGEYVIQLGNEYGNLKNPYIVALFKKK